nr:hypothetical protein Iba_chr08dCG12980 [Ipomoea batatas]
MKAKIQSTITRENPATIKSIKRCTLITIPTIILIIVLYTIISTLLPYISFPKSENGSFLNHSSLTCVEAATRRDGK